MIEEGHVSNSKNEEESIVINKIEFTEDSKGDFVIDIEKEQRYNKRFGCYVEGKRNPIQKKN